MSNKRPIFVIVLVLGMLPGCSNDPDSELIAKARSLNEHDARVAAAQNFMCSIIATNLSEIEKNPKTYLDEAYKYQKIANTIVLSRSCNATDVKISDYACYMTFKHMKDRYKESVKTTSRIQDFCEHDINPNDFTTMCSVSEFEHADRARRLAIYHYNNKIESLSNQISINGDELGTLLSFYSNNCI